MGDYLKSDNAKSAWSAMSSEFKKKKKKEEPKEEPKEESEGSGWFSKLKERFKKGPNAAEAATGFVKRMKK